MKKFWKICAVVFLVVCVGAIGGILLLRSELPDSYFTNDEWKSNYLKITLEESFVESEDFSIEKLEDRLADIPVVKIIRYPQENIYLLDFDCDSKWYLIYLKLRVEKIDGIKEVDFYLGVGFQSVPNDKYYSVGYFKCLV